MIIMKIKKSVNDFIYDADENGQPVVANGFVEADIRIVDFTKLLKWESKLLVKLSKGYSKFVKGALGESFEDAVDGLIRLVKDTDEIDDKFFEEISDINLGEFRVDLADNTNNKLVVVSNKEKFYVDARFDDTVVKVDFADEKTEVELKFGDNETKVKVDEDDFEFETSFDIENRIDDVFGGLEIDFNKQELVDAWEELKPSEEPTVDDVIEVLEAIKDYAGILDVLFEQEDEEEILQSAKITSIHRI